MMLDYMGWNEASSIIEEALEYHFKEGLATHDLARFMENGQSLSTTEFSNKIVQYIKSK